MKALVDIFQFINTSKPMHAMEPFEVGIVDDNRFQPFNISPSNPIVMRTASSNKKEVMDLSNNGIDSCWTWDSTHYAPDLNVRPLRRTEKVKFLDSSSSLFIENSNTPTLFKN